MILLITFLGALIGWIAADLESWGLTIGGVAGLGAGWAMRVAVRKEIARASDVLRAEMRAMLALAPPSRADTAPDSAPATERHAAAPESREVADLVAEVRRTVADRERVRDEPDGDLPAADAGVAVPLRVKPVRSGPTIAQQIFNAARSWLLGGNTIVRAGLAILFVGLSFLARYAASAGLFPVELRLALVVAVAIALLIVGFRTRERRPAFGLALQGTGVATIYLTVFAAARLFEIVPILPAFAVMILICALSCALALLQNAQGLAVAAFIGGFAVPLLLASGSGNSAILFGYYTMLNLAVLLFARMRSWRMVTLVGFFGTFGVATLWGFTSYGTAEFAIAQAFLIASVLIYVAAAVLYTRNTPGRFGNAVDTGLLFGPALAGFGLEVGLVEPFAFGTAFAALGFATLYLAVAAIMIRRGRSEYRLMNEALLAIGVGFVTLAVPLALGARWTTSAWALEGAGAFWIGMRQARWLPRLFGLLLQLVAALILFGNMTPNISALPLLDPAFIGAALVALAAMMTAWWLRAPIDHGGSRLASAYAGIERRLGEPAFLFGFAFGWLALILEATRALPPVLAGADPQPVFAPPLQPLLIMLAFVASAGVAAGFGRRWRWPVALWPSRVTLLPIALTFLAQTESSEQLLYTPDWAIWLVTLGLHFWLLYRDETATADQPVAASPWWHRAAHIGGVWLLAGMLADGVAFGIDRAGLWNSSWAGVAFLVSTVAVLLILTLWAAAAGDGDARSSRWPLRWHKLDYGWFAAAPIAALLFIGALATALGASGDTAPLPYIPLLNPVDLSLMLALAILLLWRRTVLQSPSHARGMAWLRRGEALMALAILGFIMINTIWLRFSHHQLGIAWTGESLLDSFVVQMGLAILWTLLALGLMLFAHRRADRAMWITGAGLLGLVVAKLLLVDLNNEDGAVRIITFMVVGVLMLVVGYFAPLPPRAAPAPPMGERAS